MYERLEQVHGERPYARTRYGVGGGRVYRRVTQGGQTRRTVRDTSGYKRSDNSDKMKRPRLPSRSGAFSGRSSSAAGLPQRTYQESPEVWRSANHARRRAVQPAHHHPTSSMASIFKTNPAAAIIFLVMILAALAFVVPSLFFDEPAVDVEHPTENDRGVEQVTPQ